MLSCSRFRVRCQNGRWAQLWRRPQPLRSVVTCRLCAGGPHVSASIRCSLPNRAPVPSVSAAAACARRPIQPSELNTPYACLHDSEFQCIGFLLLSACGPGCTPLCPMDDAPLQRGGASCQRGSGENCGLLCRGCAHVVGTPPGPRGPSSVHTHTHPAPGADRGTRSLWRGRHITPDVLAAT